jgi:PAS domain S-box-containing protein
MASGMQPSMKKKPDFPAPDFRALFDLAPAAHLVILPDDPTFTIVIANEAYLGLVNLKPEDLTGQGVFKMFPDNPDHPTASGVRNLRDSLRRAIATRGPDLMPEQRYDVQPSGPERPGFEERYWRILNTPILDEYGGIGYILISVEEVTGRIRAERREHRALQELRTSETRFRQLAETSTFGLLIGDLEGNLFHMNSTARELLGYTSQDIAAGLVRWDRLTPPEFAALDAEALRQLSSTGRCAPYEKAYIAKDGKYVPVLLGASCLDSGDGPAEVAAFILDLTERKRAERRDAFLVQLDDAVRTLTDPDEITRTVARLLGEQLQVDRCTYCCFDADQETLNITWDHTRPGMLSMAGRYTLSQFGEFAAQLLRANLPYAIEDIENDPRAADAKDAYREASIRAAVAVPLQKGGRLVAAMSLHQRTPRRWLPEELELIQLVANRCWESIERARVGRELQASERRLRLAQRIGRIGSFEWLIKEDQITWTTELEQLYGLPEGSFERSPDAWRKRLVSEDADRIVVGLRDCIEKRLTEYAYEFRVVLPDGNQRWLRGHSQFLYNEAGEPVRMIGVNFDIDAQKQAEAHLQRQWHTFDTALSHTPDFTYIFDLDGRFTYINRALLSLLQRSYEDAVGKNFFDLDYPPELAGRLQRQIQQVIETKRPLRDHTPFTSPAGETGHYEYIFVPVFGKSGQVEAVAGSTRDITDREHFERALAQSEAKLQQVFMQAPVAILVLRGRDLTIELANPSYRALLNERELLGRKLAEVVPELGQHVWDALYSVLDTGEPFVANDWLVPYDRDGDGIPEDHWFNVVYNPWLSFDGTVSGIIAVLIDVTPQVLARKELERVNHELEEFAFVASHDLQEPLRMINIYSQLIVRSLPEKDVKLEQYSNFVRQGVARMEALIHDLLTFSSTVHEDDSQIGTADLSASLSEAVSVLKDRIEESGTRITAPSLPNARGDTQQMTHVFLNLIANSIKYRNPSLPPRITISATRENDQWIIMFRDNGIGFEQQYAKRIFGLFKRLHKSDYPGTGLGLAICERIVQRYGGRMWAEGKPGQGSTFYFALCAA